MKVCVFIIASLASSCLASPSEGCPRRDLFAPCRCPDSVTIDCSAVSSTEELATSFSNEFQDHGPFEQVVIERSPIESLPSHIFTTIQSHVFIINENRKLWYVGEDAFSGSEDVIKSLEMPNNILEGESIFIAISKMRRLTFVSLANNRLRSVPERAFSKMSEITSVDLSDNFISSLGSETFAYSPKLRDVMLYDNLLTTLPSRFLALLDGTSSPSVSIILTNNQITDIAHDAFSEIYRDVHISFYGNRLQTLERNALQPLLLQNGTTQILLAQNPFVCDCKLSWLLENRQYFDIFIGVTCFDSNKELKDYSVEDLGKCAQ